MARAASHGVSFVGKLQQQPGQNVDCVIPLHRFLGQVNVRKDSGLEHPMWLIADPSSYLHCMVLNNINDIFVDAGASYADFLRHQPEVLAELRACRRPKP